MPAPDLKRFLLLILLSFLFTFPAISYGQLVEHNSPAVETTGDVFLYSLPTATLATTLIVGDYKGSFQFFKSFVVNGLVTYGMKAAINKPRPFRSGDQAFPSGHTSVTFQSASFVHRRYGFKYSIPGYLMAGFTGFSRINADKHDGYDILAGAVVGIGSTLLFTTPYQQEHMQLTFSGERGYYLLGFSYNF